MSAPTLTVAAPAKVNLFLHVLGRRDDGYHRIESLFALIDLADTMTLALRSDGAIERTRAPPGVPVETDLAIRAAMLLQKVTGQRQGVSVAIDKRIPQGAGLGGGSSDAASVLLGLNRLWGLGLDVAALADIGLALGADVPFFVHGENAFVQGIGERVHPVSLPRRWLALAMPRAHARTAAIFAAPELTRAERSAKMIVFSESYGHNALQAVAASRHPEIGIALSALPGGRMTGSGAAVFAVCDSEAQARRAIDALPGDIDGRVVRTLARHPLAGFARRDRAVA